VNLGEWPVNPHPVTIGVHLCDYLLIEEATRKFSLIGLLRKWSSETFPFAVPPFFVFSLLTDCEGMGRLEFIATRLETDEEVYHWTARGRFPNRLRQSHLYFRILNCTLPAPGIYLFTLSVDGAFLAQYRVPVMDGRES
jgi:hypothetical protein